MTAATTVSGVVNFLPKYYTQLFLDMLNSMPIVAKYAMKKPLPLHEGTQVMFPRMTVTASYPTTYNIGTDGVVITPEAVNDEQVVVDIKQWGNAKSISDLVEATAISTTNEEIIKDLANQANNLLDKVLMMAAYGTGATQSYYGTAGTAASAATIGGNVGGFSVVTASAGVTGTTGATVTTSVGSADSITAASLRRWVAKLKARNVRPLDDGFFAFICHTDTAMKLLADSQIREIYIYTDPENIKNGVVGTYAGAKVQEDNNILTTTAGSAGATAYYSILLGKGGLGATELDGGVKTYIENSGGTSDPIHQIQTFGWKANFAGIVLNPLCGLICVSCDGS